MDKLLNYIRVLRHEEETCKQSTSSNSTSAVKAITTPSGAPEQEQQANTLQETTPNTVIPSPNPQYQGQSNPPQRQPYRGTGGGGGYPNTARYVPRDRPGTYPQRRDNNQTVTCYNCGEKGHYARNCRAEKKPQEEQQRGNLGASILDDFRMMTRKVQEYIRLESAKIHVLEEVRMVEEFLLDNLLRKGLKDLIYIDEGNESVSGGN